MDILRVILILFHFPKCCVQLLGRRSSTTLSGAKKPFLSQSGPSMGPAGAYEITGYSPARSSSQSSDNQSNNTSDALFFGYSKRRIPLIISALSAAIHCRTGNGLKAVRRKAGTEIGEREDFGLLSVIVYIWLLTKTDSPGRTSATANTPAPRHIRTTPSGVFPTTSSSTAPTAGS